MKPNLLQIQLSLFLPFLLMMPLQADWQMGKVTIQTPWAGDVDPANPLPEYPRPTMVREDWMNLNGLWEFQEAEKGDPLPGPAPLKKKILVPFPWQSALSGIGDHFPSKRAWYRRSFEVPSGWKGRRLLLQFGAVDWECTVFVNHQYVGSHRGGYDPFEIDITPYVRRAGKNNLVIHVFDPGTDEAIAMGKQSDRRFFDSGRYTYMPVSGIWQTVWLEAVPQRFIQSFKASPDIDAGYLLLEVHADLFEDGWSVEAIASSEGQEIARATGELSKRFSLPIPNARLWWPDDPFLYDLEFRLLDANGKEVDRVGSYFGMRKIAIADRFVDGKRGIVMGPVKKLLLNNTFVFQMGPLDQGYWPDGLYTAPTDEALRWDVEQTKAWGFNMTRKHIKVEPQRWYTWCDRVGLLVWQDMPSTFGRRTEAEEAQFEVELGEMVRDFWNHPSIVNWIVFNEHWGIYDVKRLTQWVMELDPSRVVTGNSGIDAGQPDLDYEVGHIKDNHHYRPPTNPYPTTRRAVVNGEYGAIGYLVDGHIWNPDEDEGDYVHYNYAGIDDATSEYLNFIDQLLGFKANDALSGAVYTQWTDLESELNGLYTYDRKVEKLHRDPVTKANLSLWANDRRGGADSRAGEETRGLDGGPEEIN